MQINSIDVVVTSMILPISSCIDLQNRVEQGRIQKFHFKHCFVEGIIFPHCFEMPFKFSCIRYGTWSCPSRWPNILFGFGPQVTNKDMGF
jgi:hypothetical protein